MDILEIEGIGKKYKEKLKAVGIDTVEDFIKKIKSEFRMKRIYAEQLDAEANDEFNKTLNKQST